MEIYNIDKNFVTHASLKAENIAYIRCPKTTWGDSGRTNYPNIVDEGQFVHELFSDGKVVSPFFEFYEDDFQSLFKNKSEWLLDYNFECIDLIQQCLDVNLSYKTSTTFEKEVKDDFRPLINVKNHENIQTNPYIQVFENKHGYINNLSILDVLFNLGPETLSYLTNHPSKNI